MATQNEIMMLMLKEMGIDEEIAKSVCDTSAVSAEYLKEKTQSILTAKAERINSILEELKKNPEDMNINAFSDQKIKNTRNALKKEIKNLNSKALSMLEKSIIVGPEFLERIKGATLLSTEEAEKFLIKRERNQGKQWWLRSPGRYKSHAACINIDGSISHTGHYVDLRLIWVYPVLQISNLESLNLQIGIGTRFEFGKRTFKIISNNLAFCEEDIGSCVFREDFEAHDANCYETSDVKKFVDEWFARAMKYSEEIIEQHGVKDDFKEIDSTFTKNISCARLLSTREAEWDLTLEKREYKRDWWLRPSGDAAKCTDCVYSNGHIGYGFGDINNSSFTVVRPALVISNLESSNFQIDDRFEFGEKIFRIISDSLAFCEGDIGRCVFNEDIEAADVKKFVDEWFTKAMHDAMK